MLPAEMLTVAAYLSMIEPDLVNQKGDAADGDRSPLQELSTCKVVIAPPAKTALGHKTKIVCAQYGTEHVLSYMPSAML